MSDFRIIKLNAISSTNDYLKSRAQSGLCRSGDIVIADYQTQGRGQRERQWLALSGENLTFSGFWKPEDFGVADQFLITMAVSFALIEALIPYAIPELKIKWPNDIMAGNKKIGGILIENTLSSNQVDYSIIGIGINVNQTQFEDLPRASSLRLLMGQSFDVSTLFQSCLEALHSFFFHVKSLQKEIILEAYNRYLFGKDRWLNIDLNQTSIIAKMVEVTADGHPIVLDQEGTLTNLKGKIVRFHWD